MTLKEIERARDQALKKSQEVKQLLHSPGLMQDISTIAQAANDAWLDYLKHDTAYKNLVVMKQMEELYGCFSR